MYAANVGATLRVFLLGAPAGFLGAVWLHWSARKELGKLIDP